LRLNLVAEGSDGYKAVTSLAEVNPDLHDGTVIVAGTVDRKPLARSGPLEIVAAGERRPAHWVRNLVAVGVLTAE
jgi:malonyl CoA-acyl carrier protein transacylase